METNKDKTDILHQIINSALDLKAINTTRISFEGKSTLTDHFVICSGTSSAHNQGIADRIALNLKKNGVLPLGMEGYEEGNWILIDYNTVIVHIFLQAARELYELEELYSDYPMEHFE